MGKFVYFLFAAMMFW